MQYIKNLPEVPDFAMVPKFLIKSSFVIPIPLSRIERIFFSLSNLIYITSYYIKIKLYLKLSLSSAWKFKQISNLDLKLRVVTFT